MKKLFYAIPIFISLVLFACNGNEVKDSISKIRFINASSISGDINVFIDYNKVFATDIVYLSFSLFTEHIATTHTIQIKTASGNLIKEMALDMVENKTYSIFVYDSMNTTRVKLIEENFSVAQGSYCKLRFLHLSNNAPATDVTQGTDTSILFSNYSNGDLSDYTIFPIDSVYFNAHNTGIASPYYTQPRYNKFKAGNFYTMCLKGNQGSTGIDSLGFFIIENNATY